MNITIHNGQQQQNTLIIVPSGITWLSGGGGKRGKRCRATFRYIAMLSHAIHADMSLLPCRVFFTVTMPALLYALLYASRPLIRRDEEAGNG